MIAMIIYELGNVYEHGRITMVNSRTWISDGMLYMLVLHIYLADYALIYRDDNDDKSSNLILQSYVTISYSRSFI